MQYLATALALFAAVNAVALPSEQSEQADQAKQAGQADQAGQNQQNGKFWPGFGGQGFGGPGGFGRRPGGFNGGVRRPAWGGNRGGWGGNGNRWGGNGGWQPDGDENGPYQPQCVCTVNDQEAPQWLTQNACGDLNSAFPNLDFDQWSSTCIDNANRGLEQNGFAAACQRQGNQLSQNPFNIGSGGGQVSGQCF